MKQVYDRLRRQWVAATPEELVRQSWLHKMVEQLHYPPSLLVVEKELKHLPHLSDYEGSLPNRRVDILSFDRLRPLLLIECKQRVSEEAMEQAVAYNLFVQAAFVAIVDQNQICLRSHDRLLDWLPPFSELRQYE